MKRNRICYCLLLLCAAAAWFFANHTGTRLLLAALLAVPLVSWTLLRCFPPRAEASFDAPPYAVRDDDIPLSLKLQAGSRLPILFRGTLFARNLYSGEQSQQPLELVLRRDRPVSLSPALACPHCGKLELSLRDCCGTDLLGLFRVKLPVSKKTECTVLPRRLPIAVSVTEDEAFLTDSRSYSAMKAGYDPSETLQLREYRPGDSIRQIHWKLTEKTETVMVRDFGLPILSRLLLLVQPGDDPDRFTDETMLDTLYSVSLELLRQDIVFELGWTAEEETLRLLPVTDPEALKAALGEIFSLPRDLSRPSVCAVYARQNPLCAYAHAAVFSAKPLPDYALLYHGNRVTALLPPETSAAFFDPASSISYQPFCPALSELEL